MNTAQRLRQLREQRGLSPQQVAERIGVDRTTVTKYETGGSKPTRNLEKLAALYGVTIDYILCKNKDTDTPPSFYHDPDVAQFANAVHKNPDLRILFHASKNLDKDSLNSVVDFVKFQKAKAEGGAWDE